MPVIYKTPFMLVKISLSFIPLGFSLRRCVVGCTKLGVIERAVCRVFGDCPTFPVPIYVYALIRSKYII